MKVKYGADELRIQNADETIGDILRSPRMINGLGLPENYKVVSRTTGEEVNLDEYPVEGETYVVEVREQKKNAKTQSASTKKPTVKATPVKPAAKPAPTKKK